MSFEGFFEYLCERGHYSVTDVFDDELEICPICESEIEFRNLVDETNGIEWMDPFSHPAKKEVISWDDQWRQDHYGNWFAVKIETYAPDDKRWKQS